MAEHFSVQQIIEICLNIGFAQTTNRVSSGEIPYNGVSFRDAAWLTCTAAIPGTLTGRGEGLAHDLLERIAPTIFLSISGTALRTLTSSLGGSGDDLANAIALAPAGVVYVTGRTLSTVFPSTREGFQPLFGGGSDAFVVKLDLRPAGALARRRN